MSKDIKEETLFFAPTVKGIEKYTLLAILVACATAIQVLEAPLPRILPWLKPGLSNVLILYAIVRISPKFGFATAVLRNILTSLTLGTLFSPVQLISFAGGISSSIAMAIVFKLIPRAGLITISVVGALVNNLAQLWAVQILFAGSLSIWMQLAIMIWVAIPSGLIVAKVTQELLRRTT